MSLSPLPSLPDIDEVPPLDDADDKIFAEVRAVLKQHGALQRFGVTLLHQHFPLAEGEVLVEQIDAENRILTTRPRTAEQSGLTRETSWRLDDQTGARRCETQCQTDRDYEGKPTHLRRHYTTS